MMTPLRKVGRQVLEIAGIASTQGLITLAEEALWLLSTGDVPDEAVWHPLGFGCMVLADEGRCRVRLHVWPEARREPYAGVEPIHNHSWRLDSVVLAGSLVNHVVELGEDVRAADDDRARYQLTEVVYTGSVNELRPTVAGRRLEQDRPTRYVVGDRYALDAGSFHWTEPAALGTVATLVVAETVPGRATLTAMTRPQPWIMKREPMTTVAVAELAVELSECIRRPVRAERMSSAERLRPAAPAGPTAGRPDLSSSP